MRLCVLLLYRCVNPLSSGRFLFVLLGPHGKGKSYNEIGRAIATLMVDDVRMTKSFCVLKS